MKLDSFIGSRECTVTVERAIYCYEVELRRLSKILSTKELFPEVSAFLPDEKHAHRKAKRLEKTTKRSLPSLINLSEFNELIWKSVAYSQIPVCCQLFNNKSVSIQPFDDETAKAAASDFVNETMLRNKNAITETISKNLNIADSLRVVYLLKSLGLIRWRAETAQQLSLAPSSGVRDLLATHARVWLEKSIESRPFAGLRGECLTMHVDHPGPRHVVMIDGDPALKNIYARLNKIHGSEALGIPEYTDTAFPILAREITNGTVLPRNIILAYRIDHHMLHDVDEFFVGLRSVIGEYADLVFTIGAGDTAEEFGGRLAAFSACEEYLKLHNMRPVRIRMFRDNVKDLEAKRGAPMFGIPEFNSYEILYCKLARKKL